MEDSARETSYMESQGGKDGAEEEKRSGSVCVCS
jgi:hypothetical protein